MMRLPPETILAGVSNTLEHDVLPTLTDRSARGLIFAAIEVLANVKDLVEWKTDLRDEENAAAAEALAKVIRSLDGAGLPAASSELAQARERALAETDREACGRALDAALERALMIVDDERGRPGVHIAGMTLRMHLVNQTLRDAMRVQRPLLNRISQG